MATLITSTADAVYAARFLNESAARRALVAPCSRCAPDVLSRDPDDREWVLTTHGQRISWPDDAPAPWTAIEAAWRAAHPLLVF